MAERGWIKIFSFHQNHLLAWGYLDIWSHIWVDWVFYLIKGGPATFLCKISFDWGWVKISASNHNRSLALGYPESLSQIRVGLFFPNLGCSPPLYCIKQAELCCRLALVRYDFVSFLESFIGLRLPWKFEPNLRWLNFCLIWGAPLFLLEIEFWLRGVREIFTIITIFYCPEVTLKVWAKSK